ncbi:MAG: hypothetical protein AAGF46_13375, partial [Pseudomonadota bacterium]
MAWYVRALSASALVLAGGVAIAQDYIDLEAERQAQSSTNTRPADPYATSTTPAYPTTSYGLNAAPAAPASPAQSITEPTATGSGA